MSGENLHTSGQPVEDSAATRYEDEWFDAFQRAFRHVPLNLYDEDLKPAWKALDEMLGYMKELESDA